MMPKIIRPVKLGRFGDHFVSFVAVLLLQGSQSCSIMGKGRGLPRQQVCHHAELTGYRLTILLTVRILSAAGGYEIFRRI
jgi:hypothetical protein